MLLTFETRLDSKVR